LLVLVLVLVLMLKQEVWWLAAGCWLAGFWVLAWGFCSSSLPSVAKPMTVGRGAKRAGGGRGLAAGLCGG
jgi:hypothetical protein